MHLKKLKSLEKKLIHTAQELDPGIATDVSICPRGTQWKQKADEIPRIVQG